MSGEMDSLRAFLHNLSNPLAITVGMVEMVQEDLEDHHPDLKENIEFLKKAKKALDRMSVLIQEQREKIMEGKTNG